MTSRAQKRVLWQQRLAELEASGMTRTAYCTARGIGRSTLQRWQRRLSREADAEEPQGTAAGLRRAGEAYPALVPIRVAGPVATPLDLVLTWPSGLRLQLPVAADAGWLAALLRGLGC